MEPLSRLHSKSMMACGPDRIALAGVGSIGVGWAAVFARAGLEVALYDPDPARLAQAPFEVRERLTMLHETDLLDQPVSELMARVRCETSLSRVCAGASHVQESAAEDLPLKRALLAEIDHLCGPAVTIASSSSALRPSTLADGLAGRSRCMVAHPGNPPYLLPIVEIVPASFTDTQTVESVERLLRRSGMSPVRLAREVEGFVFNRLQGAVLREAYCLVRDGVASVEQVDRIMRDGPGRRWALFGPFETADLGTRGGIASHAQKMGPAYARMGAQRGQGAPWTPGLIARVEKQRRALMPLERWDEEVKRRDRDLAVLTRAIRDLGRPE